jgi:hypothetical protein
MDEKQRSGLVSYGGDSEISDSEDERASWSSSPPYPVVVTNTLGIPTSKPRQPSSPPSFIKPEVHLAPLTGLVDYHLDDDEDADHSKAVDTPTTADEVFKTNISTLSSIQQDEDSKSKTVVVSEDKNISNVKDADSSLEQGEKNEDKSCLFLPLSGVCLPPEPQGRCSNTLQVKIVSYLQKKAVGVDFGESIQNRKDFRNPSIYEKLVSFCNLDEFGSNYPEDNYNPHEWGDESLYKNLRKAQMKAYEKKERAKLERTKVEFVTGTKRPAPVAVITGSGAEIVKKPRRSKWDIGVGSGAESGGSRGTSPHKERPPLLGAAPRGIQPLPVVGAQAKVQATQLSKELARLKNKQ